MGPLRDGIMTSSETLHSLVQSGRVHRRLYTDPAIFEAEMERIFGGAWIYVGHESQVRKPGDYVRTFIGRKPVVLVRDKAKFASSTINALTAVRW